MKKAVNIIFDGPPGPQPGRFVEVETDDGKGIDVGEWIEKADGRWALRIIADVKENPYRFKAGDRVMYHPIIGREDDGKVYVVRLARVLGGRNCYHLEGKAGCVAEEALSMAEGEDL